MSPTRSPAEPSPPSTRLRRWRGPRFPSTRTPGDRDHARCADRLRHERRCRLRDADRHGHQHRWHADRRRGGPSGIAITPNGQTAYVVNNDDDTVTPITLATDTPGTPIAVGDAPVGIAITPDGTKAYVTNQAADTVTPITLATSTPGSTIHVGDSPMGIAITPTAIGLVANQDDDTVTPITLATETPGTPYAVGEGPTAIAITPDGFLAYVVDTGKRFGDADLDRVRPPPDTDPRGRHPERGGDHPEMAQPPSSPTSGTTLSRRSPPQRAPRHSGPCRVEPDCDRDHTGLSHDFALDRGAGVQADGQVGARDGVAAVRRVDVH